MLWCSSPQLLQATLNQLLDLSSLVQWLTMIWWSFPLTIPRSFLETAGDGQAPTCSIFAPLPFPKLRSVHEVDNYHSTGIQVCMTNWPPSDNPSEKQGLDSVRERGKPHLRLVPLNDEQHSFQPTYMPLGPYFLYKIQVLTSLPKSMMTCISGVGRRDHLVFKETPLIDQFSSQVTDLSKARQILGTWGSFLEE